MKSVFTIFTIIATIRTTIEVHGHNSASDEKSFSLSDLKTKSREKRNLVSWSDSMDQCHVCVETSAT